MHQVKNDKSQTSRNQMGNKIPTTIIETLRENNIDDQKD